MPRVRLDNGGGQVSCPMAIRCIRDLPLCADCKAAAARPAKPSLTKAQRRRVRELIEDEGHTRAEALAWVLAFEPAVAS